MATNPVQTWLVTFDVNGAIVSTVPIDAAPATRVVVVYATSAVQANKAANNLRGQ